MITQIYVLCEPDGEIRYIGKTSRTFLERFREHLKDARVPSKKYRHHHCCNWIRSLLSRGYLPTIQLIGEVEGDGSMEERAWINYGQSEGWRLVNYAYGGEGRPIGCSKKPTTPKKYPKPKLSSKEKSERAKRRWLLSLQKLDWFKQEIEKERKKVSPEIIQKIIEIKRRNSRMRHLIS